MYAFTRTCYIRFASIDSDREFNRSQVINPVLKDKLEKSPHVVQVKHHPHDQHVGRKNEHEAKTSEGLFGIA